MAAIITVAMTVVVKSIAARAAATALCIGASGIRQNEKTEKQQKFSHG
jgi:hypothetical protein